MGGSVTSSPGQRATRWLASCHQPPALHSLAVARGVSFETHRWCTATAQGTRHAAPALRSAPEQRSVSHAHFSSLLTQIDQSDTIPHSLMMMMRNVTHEVVTAHPRAKFDVILSGLDNLR
eukprot:COSAG01_NODE_3716_length_5768_cov_2.878462_6_plen_120_part_00